MCVAYSDHGGQKEKTEKRKCSWEDFSTTTKGGEKENRTLRKRPTKSRQSRRKRKKQKQPNAKHTSDQLTPFLFFVFAPPYTRPYHITSHSNQITTPIPLLSPFLLPCFTPPSRRPPAHAPAGGSCTAPAAWGAKPACGPSLRAPPPPPPPRTAPVFVHVCAGRFLFGFWCIPIIQPTAVCHPKHVR